MRAIIALIGIMAWSIACNRQQKANPEAPKSITTTVPDSTPSKRSLILDELSRIKQVIHSGDKEKIATLFPFPLSDSLFSIYVDDSAYMQQWNSNNNRHTKAMFLKHYPQVSSAILLEDINTLFQKINLNSLLHKDTVEYRAIKKEEPCFTSYAIEITDSLVALCISSNSNPQYQSKKQSDDDDVPENSSEFCEHSFWWMFQFSQNKLRLIKILAAG